MSDKNKNQNIGIILLAAGNSSRMGQSKQFLDVSGEALLRKTVRVAAESKVNCIVVLGARKEEHTEIIKDLPVEIIVNTSWQRGIGSSIKAGLTYILNNYPFTKAVLILVCDQPYLTSSHLQKILNRYNSTGAKIVASYYSDTLGVPALFDRSLFTELLNLDDQHGAKRIINNHEAGAEMVEFARGEIDLDTPEDYIRLKK